MSANCNHIVSTLKRDGTGRNQLQDPKLSPESVDLQDFELNDWLVFALNFSKYLHFFPSSLSLDPAGDWRNFFKTFTTEMGIINELEEKEKLEKLKTSINEFLADHDQTGKLTPHLTLFIAFLKLLETSKKRFNGLTKRHLDYYYHEILHLDKENIQPDHVYLIFELAKNSSQERLEKNTAFDGGKDGAGIKRIYRSQDETVLNKAKVGQLKSIYNEISLSKEAISRLDTPIKTGTFLMAPIANSYDGLGADFPKGAEKWWPFGHTKICNASTQLPELPVAKLGFCLASRMFRLQEGVRKITLEFSFAKVIISTPVTAAQLNQALTLSLTGEKDWISGTSIQLAGESVISASSNKMMLVFELDNEQPPVVPYDAKLHAGTYDVAQPILRIIFQTANKEGYNLYRLLNGNQINSLKISTEVSGITNVLLENDLGALNPAKPFLPFGPRPGKGASFSVKFPESEEKPITNFTFQMDYLNTPDDMVAHYAIYGATNEDDSISPTVQNLDYFSVTSSPSHDNPSNRLFYEKTAGGYGSAFNFDLAANEWMGAANKALKIRLTNSFLHEKYAHYFTVSAINNRYGISIDEIPNEPYTPLAENLLLSYDASETINFASSSAENKLVLIHETPFGFHQVFSEGSTNSALSLVPAYCQGGELYIGLENTKALQQVTLLLQFLEGSENPDITDIFTGNQQIDWKYLSKNEWKNFETGEITKNQTPRFLKSGIFQFSLPKLASNDTTLLPGGYHWIKASMSKPFDAVSQLIAIKAQAVEAVFENQNNSGDHLEKGLPAKTISKLQERLSWVKAIDQPYASAVGKERESDVDYYRRVSERLRHKNRAIAQWDYEHLILQKFPKVYKVKCLNHTCSASFQSPGNVTIILVPDTTKQSVFDSYQPRVSQATLNEVSTFVNELNSFHVQAKVINPHYEEVKVSVKVKFKVGLDASFYLGQMKEDIKRFLSPWAYDSQTTVEFGITLHRSQLILYLEELPYVDYLEDIKLLKRQADSPPCQPVFIEVAGKEFVLPSNPKSILVSAKVHDVTLITSTCSSQPQNTEEPCRH